MIKFGVKCISAQNAGICESEGNNAVSIQNIPVQQLPAPTNGQIMIYNSATNTWEYGSGGGSGSLISGNWTPTSIIADAAVPFTVSNGIVLSNNGFTLTAPASGNASTASTFTYDNVLRGSVFKITSITDNTNLFFGYINGDPPPGGATAAMAVNIFKDGLGVIQMLLGNPFGPDTQPGYTVTPVALGIDEFTITVNSTILPNGRIEVFQNGVSILSFDLTMPLVLPNLDREFMYVPSGQCVFDIPQTPAFPIPGVTYYDAPFDTGILDPASYPPLATRKGKAFKVTGLGSSLTSSIGAISNNQLSIFDDITGDLICKTVVS